MALSDEQRHRLVAGYIGAASRDLKVADLIVESRDPDVAALAAYHVQQCAEKVAKALFAARGFTITKEHRLDINIKAIASEPLAIPLASFVRYDSFATTTRYPSTSGKLAAGPALDELGDDVEKLRSLLAKAREELDTPETPPPVRSQ
jgi:HEPN domain-containing protein